MATHAPTPGAPTRAPAEWLNDASCWLEQIDGVCTIIAQHLEARSNCDCDAVSAIYGMRSLAHVTRRAVNAAVDLIEGRA